MTRRFERPSDDKKLPGERGDGIKQNLELCIFEDFHAVLMYINDYRPEVGMSILGWLTEKQRLYEKAGPSFQQETLLIAQCIKWFTDLHTEIEHLHTKFSILQDTKL